MKLTHRHKTIAAALANSTSQAEVARQFRVRTSTIIDWLKEEEFVAEVEFWQTVTFEDIRQRLSGMHSRVISAVEEAIESARADLTHESASVRGRARGDIIKLLSVALPPAAWERFAAQQHDLTPTQAEISSGTGAIVVLPQKTATPMKSPVQSE